MVDEWKARERGVGRLEIHLLFLKAHQLNLETQACIKHCLGLVRMFSRVISKLHPAPPTPPITVSAC